MAWLDDDLDIEDDYELPAWLNYVMPRSCPVSIRQQTIVLTPLIQKRHSVAS